MLASHNTVYILCAWVGLAVAGAAYGQEPQSVKARPVLGNEVTPFLRYDSSVVATNAKISGPVTNMAIAGTWSAWTGRYPMVSVGSNLWELDTRTLGARLGRHEFKFIVNSEWESGDNRLLPLNLDGEI